MKKPSNVSVRTLLNIVLLILVALLLSFSVLLVREKLIHNTYEMGTSLAKSYAAESELRLDDYLKVLDLGKQYMDQMELAGASDSEIHDWMQDYSIKLMALFDDLKVDPYAVLDGEIVAAYPWEGDADYDYRITDWYQEAVKAGGEPVFTDVYIDAITGSPIFTVSQQLSRQDDVLAMDIYLENAAVLQVAASMPENYQFFLLDAKGNFLYSSLADQQDDAAVTAYMSALLGGMQDGSLLTPDAAIRDPQGLNRGVYYAGMNNGWTVIVTIPVREILMGEQSYVVYFLAILSVVLFLILFGMIVRDVHSRKRISDDGNTIRILSHSFFAIYRVNFETGCYSAVKISPDLEDRLPPKGDYSLVLEAVKELVHPRTYQEFEQNFCIPSIQKRVAEDILDYGGDYQRRFGDHYRWINIRTIYKRSLAPHEVILCFRDVDVEKRQQLQHMTLLQDALDTAKRSTKAKSAFFSNMSHDMRTPLNAIIGFSALAQQSPDDCAKQQEYIRKIEFSAKQLLSLINDILEVSKMEAGRSALDAKVFNLREYVTEVADLFQTQAAQESKSFTVKLDIQNEGVKGDPFKISQILNNLLSNAFKYSNKGAEIRLEVRQQDHQNHSKYQFVISDTGIGMSEEYIAHLFDPYTRETHFSIKPTIGTGLGMTIVKNLVEQMSGELSVESKLGEGSRFTVAIPLETVADAASAPVKEAVPEARTIDLSGRRMLVAEDNELNMEITAELLSLNGVEVVQARNGQEAVELFQASAPYSIDAILMDMQMPVMDGCEAARAIRQLDKPDAADVPIIAVTANAFAEDIARTTGAGMNSHISKPIDFELLRQTLEQYLRPGGDPSTL